MSEDASTTRREIELTRGRMGDCVGALGYEADVSARDDVQERVESAKGRISDVIDNVRAAVGAVGGAAVNAGRNQVGAFSDTTGNVRDRVGQLNGAISDRVGGLNDAVNDRLQNVDVPGSARRTVGAIQENPIGLALAALSIGFLTGSLLPISEIERKRLEPIGSKLVDQAQATASDLVEAGKAVMLETAQTAVTAAMNSAQSHGQDVVEAAKARAAQH
jgi:uncharacterized protein YjbJ (UPF0337 family)